MRDSSAGAPSVMYKRERERDGGGAKGRLRSNRNGPSVSIVPSTLNEKNK